MNLKIFKLFSLYIKILKFGQVVQEELGSVERVTLIDPLDYEPFAIDG